MGWVSYLEDKLDRLNSDLDSIRRARKSESPKSTLDSEQHLKALVRVCEKFMADIRKHLDLATDPDVDVADEVLTLRKENAALQMKVGILADTETKLAESVARCKQLRKDFDGPMAGLQRIILSWKN